MAEKYFFVSVSDVLVIVKAACRGIFALLISINHL
jgi:hypothetical protein